MSVSASFAKPTGLFDNWFNKLVSKVTFGEYCHCEFIFSWSEAEQLNSCKQINLIFKYWINGKNIRVKKKI